MHDNTVVESFGMRATLVLSLSLETEAVVRAHKVQSSNILDTSSSILSAAETVWAGLVVSMSKLEGTQLGAVLDALYAEYIDLISRDVIDPNKVGSVTAEAALAITGKRAC